MDLEFPGIAITDHGVFNGLYSADRVVKKLIAEYERPFKLIWATEAYLVEDRFTKPPPRKRKTKTATEAVPKEASGVEGETTGESFRNHLTLLVKNEEGYRNLCMLMEQSYREGGAASFRRTIPQTDLDLIRQYHQGLICLSGCVLGPLSDRWKNGNQEGAFRFAEQLKKIFGKEFYIEIMPTSFADQKIANEGCLRIADHFNIPVIATNDCHWIKEEHYETHEVLLAIQRKARMSEPTRSQGGHRWAFEDRSYYMKTREEMIQSFQRYHDYIPASIAIQTLDQSLEIAEKVTFQFKAREPVLPHFDLTTLPEDELKRFRAWQSKNGVKVKGWHSRGCGSALDFHEKYGEDNGKKD